MIGLKGFEIVVEFSYCFLNHSLLTHRPSPGHGSSDHELGERCMDPGVVRGSVLSEICYGSDPISRIRVGWDV